MTTTMAASSAAASKQSIRDHYDSFAGFYRAFWGDHIHHGLFLRGNESSKQAQIQLLEHCVALSGVGERARVLDVGCGHGGTSIYLARRHGCQVTGLTLSPRQAELAARASRRAGVKDRVEFVVADAEHYEFPAGRYDAVWTMESSEHFAAKARYFRNAASALAPQGTLLLAAWTGNMRSPRVAEVARIFLCPELQTADEYRRQMQDAGLSIAAEQDLSCQVSRTWEICRWRTRLAAPIKLFVSADKREFVRGIDVILDGYRAGDLRYSLLIGRKN